MCRFTMTPCRCFMSPGAKNQRSVSWPATLPVPLFLVPRRREESQIQRHRSRKLQLQLLKSRLLGALLGLPDFNRERVPLARRCLARSLSTARSPRQHRYAAQPVHTVPYETGVCISLDDSRVCFLLRDEAYRPVTVPKLKAGVFQVQTSQEEQSRSSGESPGTGAVGLPWKIENDLRVLDEMILSQQRPPSASEDPLSYSMAGNHNAIKARFFRCLLSGHAYN